MNNLYNYLFLLISDVRHSPCHALGVVRVTKMTFCSHII